MIEGIKTAKVTIEGVAPMLMHNARLANPADDIVKQIKAITGKHHSKKTEADELKLMELEYMGGLYFDDSCGAFIPSVNIEGCLRDGAKISRKGKAIESGIQVNPDCVKLLYDGPKTAESLYADKRFVDCRAAKLQKSSTVMRTRPRFDNWSAEFEILIIEDVVNPSDVHEALVKAGMMKGLGDFRPKFGRFVVREFLIK